LPASASTFPSVVDALADCLGQTRVGKVIGIDAKGFILAAPIALRLGAGFVPLRKAGKLPSLVESDRYDMHYGTDELQIHTDALAAGERAIIIDDLLATVALPQRPFGWSSASVARWRGSDAWWS
jgi:adenine phosphoribosyltransferase